MQKTVFNIAKDNKNDNTNIWIQGFIGESYWNESTSAVDFVAQLNAIETPNITVFLNSRGGSVTDGIAITNALIAHSAKITTVNASCAMSIASIILQAGDKRLAFPNAITMVHDCSTYAGGNAKSLRDDADVLDQFTELLAITYRERGVEQTQIDAMLDGDDHFYNAKQALEHKLIDEVVDLNSFSAASEQLDLTPDYLTNEQTNMKDKNEKKPQPTEKKATLSDKISAIFKPKAEEQAPVKATVEAVAELSDAIEVVAQQMATDKAHSAQQVTALSQSVDAMKGQLSELVSALNEDDSAPRPLSIGSEIEAQKTEF